MGPARIIVLAVAAVAAIGLVFMVNRMMASKPAPAPIAAPAAPQKPSTNVLVAKVDLPIGRRIVRDDISWQPWPVDSLNPAFITDGAVPGRARRRQGRGRGHGGRRHGRRRRGVRRGEPANSWSAPSCANPSWPASRSPSASSSARRGRLHGRGAAARHAAIVVPVTVETGAGGFILPGDRVDVLQSRRVDKPANGGGGPSGGQDVESRTMLTNIRVLAIDQATEPPKGDKAVVGAVATLEVAAADAPLVARAKTQGDLILALRSYADAGGPSGRAISRGRQRRQVKVFRAGQVTEVTVSQ